VTATGYQRPRLRPDVVLGPGLRSGPDVVHHVKDSATGTYYRIGPREHFILGRMDGAHTLEDINAEYLQHYGRRLGEDSWRQMFTLLGQRQLLDGFTDPDALARLKVATEAKRAVRGSWAQRRWVLLQPDELCTRLARVFGFAFRRAFVVPALLVMIALEVFVWSHAGTLASDAAHRTWWPVTVAVSLLLLLGIAALHELGHGVACKHYGGEVNEIGFRWRFPMIDPYCRTDDIVLFHRRSARVVTAFAGIFMTLLALLPVLAAWALTPDWRLGHSIAAGLLLFGSFGAVANLAPFLQLDGYAMLGHALDQADLRRESLPAAAQPAQPRARRAAGCLSGAGPADLHRLRHQLGAGARRGLRGPHVVLVPQPAPVDRCSVRGGGPGRRDAPGAGTARLRRPHPEQPARRRQGRRELGCGGTGCWSAGCRWSIRCCRADCCGVRCWSARPARADLLPGRSAAWLTSRSGRTG
jgi:putative peptide zinc metalloprotease protein